MVLFHSPSGKLVQIEYALQAVAAGAPSVGIKAKNGVVIAVEKKQKSLLYDESSITKVSLFGGFWFDDPYRINTQIEVVSEGIGMVYSGMGPDFR